MRRALLVFVLVLVAGLALACSKPQPGGAPDAAALAPAALADAGPAPSGLGGAEIARTGCLSCHAEELLAQQRLPREKWAATVKKMIGWGAAVEAGDVDVLVDHLATRYGPDAGEWSPRMIGAEAARAALEPEGDGPFAGGDATHGKALFAERCASCHGPEARGLPALGLNLVERPVLDRASVLATTVRKGRGRMPPMPDATDRELADVVAHLRTLRVP